MVIVRAHANPNNHFFIAKSDGHLIGSTYLNSSDGSYFPSITKDAYEIGVGKKQARSYAIILIIAGINTNYYSYCTEEYKYS